MGVAAVVIAPAVVSAAVQLLAGPCAPTHEMVTVLVFVAAAVMTPESTAAAARLLAEVARKLADSFPVEVLWAAFYLRSIAGKPLVIELEGVAMVVGLAMAMDWVAQRRSLVLDGVIQELELVVTMDGDAQPDLQGRQMTMALFVPTRGTRSCSACRYVPCGSLTRRG